MKMTIENWLKSAETKLKQAGIGTARLDALVLAEDATGHDRTHLLSHPELSVRGPASHKLDAQIRRRMNHEPLAYIRGKTEFYGREFLVDKRVLQPRPESETMIDLLKTVVRGPASHTVVDIGTGSGALAITAKLEIPGAKVIATDIDPGCLVVAKSNAKKHSVDITFLETDLLDSIESLKDLILIANLPYVPDDFQINSAARQEPRLAIFGGSDGLDLYRHLFNQIDTKKLGVNWLLTESMPPEHAKLAELAKKHGFNLQQTDDFIQLFVKP